MTYKWTQMNFILGQIIIQSSLSWSVASMNTDVSGTMPLTFTDVYFKKYTGKHFLVKDTACFTEVQEMKLLTGKSQQSLMDFVAVPWTSFLSQKD